MPSQKRLKHVSEALSQAATYINPVSLFQVIGTLILEVCTSRLNRMWLLLVVALHDQDIVGSNPARCLSSCLIKPLTYYLDAARVIFLGKSIPCIVMQLEG